MNSGAANSPLKQSEVELANLYKAAAAAMKTSDLNKLSDTLDDIQYEVRIISSDFPGKTGSVEHLASEALAARNRVTAAVAARNAARITNVGVKEAVEALRKEREAAVLAICSYTSALRGVPLSGACLSGPASARMLNNPSAPNAPAPAAANNPVNSPVNTAVNTPANNTPNPRGLYGNNNFENEPARAANANNTPNPRGLYGNNNFENEPAPAANNTPNPRGLYGNNNFENEPAPAANNTPNPRGLYGNNNFENEPAPAPAANNTPNPRGLFGNNNFENEPAPVNTRTQSQRLASESAVDSVENTNEERLAESARINALPANAPWYDILGLDQSSSPADVKRKGKKLQLLFHGDRLGPFRNNVLQNYGNIIKKINNAIDNSKKVASASASTAPYAPEADAAPEAAPEAAAESLEIGNMSNVKSLGNNANNTPNPRGLYGNNNFENEASSSAAPVPSERVENFKVPANPKLNNFLRNNENAPANNTPNPRGLYGNNNFESEPAPAANNTPNPRGLYGNNNFENEPAPVTNNTPNPRGLYGNNNFENEPAPVANNTPNPRGLYGNNNFENEPERVAANNTPNPRGLYGNNNFENEPAPAANNTPNPRGLYGNNNFENEPAPVAAANNTPNPRGLYGNNNFENEPAPLAPASNNTPNPRGLYGNNNFENEPAPVAANNTPNPRGLYGNNNFENEPAPATAPPNALAPLGANLITPTTSVNDSLKIMSEKAGIALPTLTMDEIDKLLKTEKKLYLTIHPNKGGDPEKFKATRELFDELRRIKEEVQTKELTQVLQEPIGNTNSQLIKNMNTNTNSNSVNTNNTNPRGLYGNNNFENEPAPVANVNTNPRGLYGNNNFENEPAPVSPANNNSIYNLPSNAPNANVKNLSKNRAVTPLNTKVNVKVNNSNRNNQNKNNTRKLPGMVDESVSNVEENAFNRLDYVKPKKTPFQRFMKGASTRLKSITQKKKPLSTKPPGQRGGKRTRKNKKSA